MWIVLAFIVGAGLGTFAGITWKNQIIADYKVAAAEAQKLAAEAKAELERIRTRGRL